MTTSLTLALAGRRPDAPNSEVSRFPLVNLPLVRDRLLKLFAERRPAILVSSAACGADLLALDAAGSVGLRRRVVLPFEPTRFRRTSVTDRPGEWAALYDSVIDAVTRSGDLVVLDDAGDGDAAYLAANERILKEAIILSGARSRPIPPDQAFAVVVWEGGARGGNDATQHFADAAAKQGLSLEQVLTFEEPRTS